MSKFNHFFVLSSALILGVTAVAKMASVFSSAPVMLMPDPLIGLSFRYLLLLAGLVELMVAAMCLFTANLKRNTLLIAWISTSLLMYRMGLWLIDWHRPCHCLGDLTEMLHMSPELADNLMKGVLLYLLLGSYAGLFLVWKCGQKSPSGGVHRFSTGSRQ